MGHGSGAGPIKAQYNHCGLAGVNKTKKKEKEGKKEGRDSGCKLFCDHFDPGTIVAAYLCHEIFNNKCILTLIIIRLLYFPERGK